MRTLMANAMVVHGEEAVRHLLRVSAGLESMVLGEREILTQVRTAMEKAREWGLAGDQLRITERIAVETAKRVFTETDIARRSVSVNALGWKAFRERDIAKDAPVLMIGRRPDPRQHRPLPGQGRLHQRFTSSTAQKTRPSNSPSPAAGHGGASMRWTSALPRAGCHFPLHGQRSPVLDAAAEALLPKDRSMYST